MKGALVRHESFPSRYVAPRHVEVWLPPGYAVDEGRRFPVVYMHDGQNLFHPETSFAGEHWGVAEALEECIARGEVRAAMVVGIWHSEERGAEYLPKRKADLDANAGEPFVDNPAADRYLRFCAEELKPFVDTRYRTRPGREDAFLMGSSRGALISLYAVCAYPGVFGAAACLSTHWPAARGVSLDYLVSALPPPGAHRFYFDFGSETLDGHYAPYQKRADAIMEAAGYRHGVDWVTRYYPGAEHSERAWRERLHVPLEFLLGGGNSTP